MKLYQDFLKRMKVERGTLIKFVMQSVFLKNLFFTTNKCKLNFCPLLFLKFDGSGRKTLWKRYVLKVFENHYNRHFTYKSKLKSILFLPIGGNFKVGRKIFRFLIKNLGTMYYLTPKGVRSS